MEVSGSKSGMAMEWVRFMEAEEVSRGRGGVFRGGVGGFSLRKEPGREGLVLMGGGFWEGGIGYKHFKFSSAQREADQFPRVQEFHKFREDKIVILRREVRTRGGEEQVERRRRVAHISSKNIVKEFINPLSIHR